MENIIIHCSAFSYGDAILIDYWHRDRGFTKIGYHFVITNGITNQGGIYNRLLDGQIQTGRSIHPFEVGAHALGGYNHKSIGICLIGEKSFTPRQLMNSRILVNYLREVYKLEASSVIGHYEIGNTDKTCPNLPMSIYRKYLEGNVTTAALITATTKHIKEIYS